MPRNAALGGRAFCARSRVAGSSTTPLKSSSAMPRRSCGSCRRPARHGPSPATRLELKAVALEDIVRAAIDVVTPAAVAKNITISTLFNNASPRSATDLRPMQQAVWNLMANAVKFTNPGGRVDAQISSNGGTAELTVRDTGQGIARDFLPYLFDRFRQADASASRRHGGLGLGLALVRQIVELHGGPSPPAAPVQIVAPRLSCACRSRRVSW